MCSVSCISQGWVGLSCCLGVWYDEMDERGLGFPLLEWVNAKRLIMVGAHYGLVTLLHIIDVVFRLVNMFKLSKQGSVHTNKIDNALTVFSGEQHLMAHRLIFSSSSVDYQKMMTRWGHSSALIAISPRAPRPYCGAFRSLPRAW